MHASKISNIVPKITLIKSLPLTCPLRCPLSDSPPNQLQKYRVWLRAAKQIRLMCEFIKAKQKHWVHLSL